MESCKFLLLLRCRISVFFICLLFRVQLQNVTGSLSCIDHRKTMFDITKRSSGFLILLLIIGDLNWYMDQLETVSVPKLFCLLKTRRFL